MTDDLRTLYRAAIEEDLRPLSGLLWHQGIAHLIVEQGGEQVVELADGGQMTVAQETLRRWRDGEIQVTLVPRPQRSGGALLVALAQVPVTSALILLSIIGFFLVYLGDGTAVSLLSYRPFEIVNGRPVFTEAGLDPWRLITPAFLHFGWMHIVFNCLWCWELGRRIERRLGALNLFGLFIATAAMSNFAQDVVSGPILFGGLSGVVYALLGFAWVAGRLNTAWRELTPSTPVMLFMVGWLLVCVFGLVNVLGFAVANAAHVGGLLSGAFIGLVLALGNRVGRV